MTSRPTLSVRATRRLALARAGLLTPERTGLPRRARGHGRRARQRAHEIVRRFGYLQLDSVSVTGARTHGIVLHSRLDGFSPELAEQLLQPDEPLFEYWGHEASWLPIELYPAFAWRREEFRVHPWWGDLLKDHAQLADDVLRRIRDEGPLRSIDLDSGPGGWWGHSKAKKVVSALWSAGELAIRERRRFQRTFDLAERVIPEEWRFQQLDTASALRVLLLKALDGHGWATTSTLAATWRFKRRTHDVDGALAALEEAGEIVACDLVEGGSRLGGRRGAKTERRVAGWIRPSDLELAEELRNARPRRDVGVLLSPFDPVLWDRGRVQQLFDFEQTLEIYKPAEQRQYGYYCLPILAGEELVGRIDLKARRREGELHVVSAHFEIDPPSPAARRAARGALERFAGALGLELAGLPAGW